MDVTTVIWLLFVIIAAGCLCLTIVQICLQNYYSILPIRAPKKHHLNHHPLVSVHIPSYNEPATLLKNTIRALARQKYQHLEVLVLDNNTPDPKVWKPVARYTQTLGRRFKFWHVDHLAGFKAGALNILRQRTDARAEYIATIDSDYETEPNFIGTALRYFADPTVGFVQFPQAYFNRNHRNLGIILEYQYFFDTYMNAANRYQSVNATGTLTIFRKQALDAIGHYNTKSITEDADIGYRFIAAGYHGVYVPQVGGRGLMPYDIADYKKQKLRWATGNAVILKQFVLRELWDRRLNLAQKANIFAQLTAWLNFTLLPVAIICVYTILLLLDASTVHTSLLAQLALALSGLTVMIYTVFTFTAYMSRYLGTEQFGAMIRAGLIHFSMYWVYASAGLRVLFRKHLIFNRTNKFISPLVPSILRQAGFEILFSLFCIALGIVTWRAGYPWLSGLLFVIAGLFGLVYYFLWEVSTTKAASAHQMLERIEPSFKH
jgi:cellulose synthase/poly-beta-1,6-N-acetylglucosamine synthase-like glycosyltransferase